MHLFLEQSIFTYSPDVKLNKILLTNHTPAFLIALG
jgi:hypothetical protein